MLGVFLLPAFTRLGHERQDLLSPCDEMHVCTTRLRFILSSEGVLGGMEFEPMLTPRKKSPLPKMSPEEDRTRDAVDSEPKHYQLSYSGPPVRNMFDTNDRAQRIVFLSIEGQNIGFKLFFCQGLGF